VQHFKTITLSVCLSNHYRLLSTGLL